MITSDRDRPGIYHTWSGTLLHLYLPGFHIPRVGSVGLPTGMCGTAAWGSRRAPLKWYDAPPTLGEPYRWCGKCLGLALVHHGHVDTALTAVTPHFTVPATA